MEWLLILPALAAGAAAGWYAAHSRGLAGRAHLAAAVEHERLRAEEALSLARQERERLQEAQKGQARAEAENARLGEEVRQAKARMAETSTLLEQTEGRFREAFQALSSEALKGNNQAFLELAKATLERYQTEARGDLESRQKAVETLVAPIKESLEKVGDQVQALERARAEAYGGLTEQVKSLIEAQQGLRAETGHLIQALRAPGVRGHWGEIQLRRVIEIAGMSRHCDFDEQLSVSTEDGRLRPDVIVKLPGNRRVVVDAKAPLKAILDTLEAATEEEKRFRRVEAVRLIRGHMGRLSAKSYWDQFTDMPDFVLMFIPSESLYMLALEQDFSLVQEGVDQRVILTSPLTLITMLKAIAFGWRQESIAENAHKISELGAELHDRLRTLANHFEGVGKGLGQAVDAYNRAVGSLESRVLVSARRFKDYGAAPGDEIKVIEPVEKRARALQGAPDLLERQDVN